MSINSAVARTLRELRQKKGVSQEKLADAIDSHQVYISEIENGKKTPSLHILYKIACYYDLSLSRFFEFVESNMD